MSKTRRSIKNWFEIGILFKWNVIFCIKVRLNLFWKVFSFFFYFYKRIGRLFKQHMFWILMGVIAFYWKFNQGFSPWANLWHSSLTQPRSHKTLGQNFWRSRLCLSSHFTIFFKKMSTPLCRVQFRRHSMYNRSRRVKPNIH